MIKYFDRVSVFLIFCTIQYFGFSWLTFPEFTYDEGYYIMAARRMMEGDWFLQHHSFDKPFLHPFLVAISGSLFGTSFVGFRLLGWIMFSGSIFLFSKTLNTIFSSLFSNKTIVFFSKLLIISFLFLSPVMIRNCATAMGEPFLISFMILILYRLSQPTSETKQAKFINAFSYAFWIKGSILIWLPLAATFNWNRHTLQNIWRDKKTLIPFLIISLVGLWYGLVGKTKLFVFRYLLDVLFATEGSHKEKLTIFESLNNWMTVIKLTYGFGFLLLVAMIVGFGLYLFCRFVKNRKGNLFFWFTDDSQSKLFVESSLAITFFFVVLFFTKVGIMDRYLLTIAPIVGFATAQFIKLILMRDSSLGKKAPSTLLAYAIFVILISTSISATQWAPPPAQPLSLSSPSIESEIPENATLINTIVWPHGAYVPKDLQIVEQPYDVRLNRHRSLLPLSPPVYAFDNSVVYEALQFKDPLSESYCPAIEILNLPILTLTLDQLKLAFLKSLLAEGKLEWTSFSIAQKPLAAPTDFVKKFDFNFRENLAGVTLTAELLASEPVKGQRPRLFIEGEFLFHRGRSLKNFWGMNAGWALSLRITRLVWMNQNLDLVPWVLVAKQGLTLPILPVVIKSSVQRPLFLSPDFSSPNKTLIIRGIEFKSTCGSAFQ